MDIRDAEEVIVDAGARSGFTVMREYPVIFWDSHEHGRIDYAWFRPGRRTPSIVFEIEGANVQKPSLRNDLRKFHWSGARHKVVFLYSVRYGAPLPVGAVTPIAAVQQRILAIQKQAYSDERLDILLLSARGARRKLIQIATTLWSDDV